MSIRVMSQVWDSGPDKQSDRFVLLALADYANDAGECWPSIKGICEKVCMSERGVQTVIRRLEDAGWLEISTGGGRSGCNKYTIKTPQEMHPAGNAPRRKCTTPPQMDAENPAAYAPEPSRTIIEPSEEPPCIPPSEKPQAKARLPDTWALSEDGWAYARSQGIPEQAITDEARGFHAYWSDRTDRDARKSARGWEQCWAGWCRRIAPRYARASGAPQPGRSGQPRSLASIAAQRAADRLI